MKRSIMLGIRMPTLDQTPECFYTTNYFCEPASDLAPTMPTMLFKAQLNANLAVYVCRNSNRDMGAKRQI
jgi:hypothetical protein